MNNLMNSKYLNREISNVDDVVNSIKNELDTIKQYNDLGGFIGDLTKPGMEGIRAIDTIFAPNNIGQFAKISNVLNQTPKGRESLQQIRTAGMNKLLQKMVDDTSSIVDGVLLNGQKLKNEMSRLGGKESMEIFFGKDLGKEIMEFADQATFLTQKKTLSGGLVAASIALNPLAKAPILIQMNVLSRLMGSRAFMNLLNRGVRNGNARDIAEIARIVGIQTSMLMDDVEDPEYFNYDLRSAIGDVEQTIPQVSQTSPTQPAAVSTPTVSPAEVPPITMMADQSISDRIEELFPEDELSKAIARRQQATGAQNA